MPIFTFIGGFADGRRLEVSADIIALPMFTLPQRPRRTEFVSGPGRASAEDSTITTATYVKRAIHLSTDEFVFYVHDSLTLSEAIMRLLQLYRSPHT